MTILCAVALGFSGYSSLAHAQEPTISPYDQIGEALDDIKEVLESYNETVTSLESMDADDIYTTFNTRLAGWEKKLISVEQALRSRLNDNDPQVRAVAQSALRSVETTKRAFTNYKAALSAETENESQNLFTQGDSLISQAFEEHSASVDLYNDSIGATDYVTARDFLIVITIMAGIFSVFLWLKSRRSSYLQTEILRAQVFSDLFKSSAWMFVGLLVTTIGMAYALANGGSYYILYGPVVFGGWSMLKGVLNYFNEGKPLLDSLSKEERHEVLSSLLTNNSIDLDNAEEKKTTKTTCKHCKTKNDRNALVCSKCGRNLIF